MSSNTTTLRDRDCRNAQSIYHSVPNPPPCLHHPSGTLKYVWHAAYDHLLGPSANRKNSYVVLLGFEHQPNYDRLHKFVMNSFDCARGTWLDLDLDSDAVDAPMDQLVTALINYVAQLRDDAQWQQKDEKVYIDMALSKFICDSHHFWMKRQIQQNAKKKRSDLLQRRDQLSNEVPATKRRRVENEAIDDGRSMLERWRELRGVAKEQNMTTTSVEDASPATAIDVETEGGRSSRATTRATVGRRPTSTDREHIARIHERQSDRNLPRTTAPTTSDTAVTSFNQPLYRQLLRTQAGSSPTAGSSTRRISPPLSNPAPAIDQQEVDRLRDENHQLKKDNAALGLALAGNSGIRRNSAAAVRNDISQRTSLPRPVAARLMENEGFTEKWFGSGRNEEGVDMPGRTRD